MSANFVQSELVRACDAWANRFALAAIGLPPANRAWAIFLGVAFAGIALSLLIASWTRWGQSKPLAKCVGIALVAHIWLLLYAYGTHIASPGIGPGNGGGMAIEPSFPASVVWVPDSMATDGIAADPLGADPLGADPSKPETPGPETGESNQPPSPAPQPWQAPIAKPFEQLDAPKLGPVETAVAAMAATAVALPEWVEMPEPSDYA
ncbi:MAG: hypothetical protein ACK5OB_20625, partial [Pirellula sp.]